MAFNELINDIRLWYGQSTELLFNSQHWPLSMCSKSGRIESCHARKYCLFWSTLESFCQSFFLIVSVMIQQVLRVIPFLDQLHTVVWMNLSLEWWSFENQVSSARKKFVCSLQTASWFCPDTAQPFLCLHHNRNPRVFPDCTWIVPQFCSFTVHRTYNPLLGHSFRQCQMLVVQSDQQLRFQEQTISGKGPHFIYIPSSFLLTLVSFHLRVVTGLPNSH